MDNIIQIGQQDFLRNANPVDSLSWRSQNSVLKMNLLAVSAFLAFGMSLAQITIVVAKSIIVATAQYYGPMPTKASSPSIPANGSNAALTAPAATGSTGIDASNTSVNRAIVAHGIIMAFTFVIVFPLGALLLRFLSIRKLIWIHAVVQLFGYLLSLTGLAIGIYIGMVPTFQVHYRFLYTHVEMTLI